MRLSDVFPSLNCKPLKKKKKKKKAFRAFFEVPCRVYLSKHPSVIQGHELAFAGKLSPYVLIFFVFSFLVVFPPPTVNPLSCTGMENIQAINASMPVQCQAVP